LWKNKKLNHLCTLSCDSADYNHWLVESLSDDGKWLVISRGENMGSKEKQSVPFDYSVLNNHKKYYIILNTHQFDENNVLPFENLKKSAFFVESYNMYERQGYGYSYGSFDSSLVRCQWHEKEKAFIFIDEKSTNKETKGKIVLKYYYPKTQITKTVLVVDDYL